MNELERPAGGASMPSFPDHYEITKHIYNQYGCYWEQTTKYKYN